MWYLSTKMPLQKKRRGHPPLSPSTKKQKLSNTCTSSCRYQQKEESDSDCNEAALPGSPQLNTSAMCTATNVREDCPPPRQARRRMKPSRLQSPFILNSLCEDSDSESDFAGFPLPTTPGTPAVWELAAQQGTILQLRQQNARMVEEFANRLSTLERIAVIPGMMEASLPHATTVSQARVSGPTIYVYPASPSYCGMCAAAGSFASAFASACGATCSSAISHTSPALTSQSLTPRQQLIQAPPVTVELLDSASASQRPEGMSLFLHLFVTRGDGCKKIELGQATWAEYFGALRLLAAHPSFPLASFPTLASFLIPCHMKYLVTGSASS